jgi:ferredoxin
MLYERYHIPIAQAPPKHIPVGKFKVIRDADICRSCGKCIKACVYGAHERKGRDDRAMEEPLSHLCKNCFRCIQECPTHALTMIMNPEYSSLGDFYWEPHRFFAISFEAETGRIPVYGAGYRGPFGGPWFDGMWTDMSEIVRPTRDGIHGREYISTSVDIGRRPPFLEFGGDGRVLTKTPSILEIQLPVIFDLMPDELETKEMTAVFSHAAAWLGTLSIIPIEKTAEVSAQQKPHVIPLVRERIREADVETLGAANVIEIVKGDRFDDILEEVRGINKAALISARVPLALGVLDEVLSLCDSKVDAAHLVADRWGFEQQEEDKRHLKQSLRELHQGLVERAMRDDISLIVSGGIAAAEHVPKAIILGADVVAVDRAMMIALECRLCGTCTAPQICPVDMHHTDHDWAVQRIVNVVGAWRDQLLEVMGAMGIREVRRLRGEMGRAMFIEDLEGDIFAPIFKEGGKHG